MTRSRTREALRALSMVGMLTIKPGDGSFASGEGDEIPEETVMWMYYQELHRHDEIYAARSLIETEVYLTCYDNRTPEVPARLDEYRDRLLDVETEEISAEDFLKVLKLSTSKESAVFYRCKILNSFHQDDRNKVKNA